MRTCIAFALILSTAACATWTPRTPAEIHADRQNDRQVANTVTDMKRDRGADGLTTGSGF